MQILSSRLLSKISLLWVLVPMLFIVSCDKDLELDNSPLNPGGELTLLISDSIPLTAYTVVENPLDGKNQSVTPLGSIQETRFGAMYGSFYANLRLTTIGFDPGANVTADSAFLFLSYNRTYGSLTQPLTIEVFELDETLVSANDYKNNTSLNVKPTPIGSLSNFVLPADSGTIKIPLTNTFAQSIVNVFGTSTMGSNDNFQSFLKGIYVTTGTSGGDALAYLQLTNTRTSLSLFFTAPSSTDSTYRFLIDNQATRVNRYVTDFSGSEVETAINLSTGNDEELYVTAFSGSKAIIEMPDLSGLESTIINKAEITFYQTDFQSTLSNDFPEPNNLFLFLNLPDSSLAFLPGVSVSNIAQFGGEKRPVTINGVSTNQYSFNITKYIQDYIDGVATTNSVALSVLSVNSGARVKIGGGNHPTLPIKLNITYTLAQ
jgi:hypothetical protein